MKERELQDWGTKLIEKVKNERKEICGADLEFSIFYTPLLFNPSVLIIGDNPGGDMSQLGLNEIPEKHEYLEYDYKLAKKMREVVFRGEKLTGLLKKSVKINRIFFRTKNLDQFEGLKNHRAIEKYCQASMHHIIEVIQPKLIIAESFGAFKVLAENHKILLTKENNNKALVKKGTYCFDPNIEVYCVNHPTGARGLTNQDWIATNQYLEKEINLN